ncbi:MAG: CehA/McbA family metallohydrolase [Chthoniobacterales bacterium]
MLYRFDLHMHSYYSGDGSNSPEALVAAAKARGLSGIAITDHNSCRAVDHCLAAGLMREDGMAVDGFLIVPGVEVSTADGHLLCIGTTLPKMVGVPAIDVEREILARGGLAIPAHPYDRWRAGIREEVMDQMQTNIIEGFNAAVTSRDYNGQAKLYAARRGKVTTAGSDAHHASAVGFASIALEMNELSVAALLRALPRGGVCDENYLTRWEGIKKHFGNWFRLFNPSPKPVVQDDQSE